MPSSAVKKKRNKKKSSKGSKQALDEKKDDAEEEEEDDDEEEECEEQREARELLGRMRLEQREFKSMCGHVEESDPQYQMLERQMERRASWLEAEVARPASERMAKSAGPPRDVLKAMATVELLEAAESCVASGILVIVRYIDDDEGKMYLGFEGLPVRTRMPWKRDYGF